MRPRGLVRAPACAGIGDTTTPHGRLTLTVLGGLAEFERHLILVRTDEGRKRAQQRGVKFGRKLKLTPHQQQEALERRARLDCSKASVLARDRTTSRAKYSMLMKARILKRSVAHRVARTIVHRRLLFITPPVNWACQASRSSFANAGSSPVV
jgi:DNA invertase Pin-like site-specific DNA recombinase